MTEDKKNRAGQVVDRAGFGPATSRRFGVSLQTGRSLALSLFLFPVYQAELPAHFPVDQMPQAFNHYPAKPGRDLLRKLV